MADDALGVLDALGVAARARRRRLDGRNDRAARGSQCAAAQCEPRQHHEFERCARPARPAPRRGGGLCAGRRSQDEGALVDFSVGLVKLIGESGLPATDRPRWLARAHRHSPRLPARWRGAPDAGDRRRQRPRPPCSRASPAPRWCCMATPTRWCRSPAAMTRPGAFRGARFVSVPGMGHDLPPQVVEPLAGHIVPFLRQPRNAA